MYLGINLQALVLCKASQVSPAHSWGWELFISPSVIAQQYLFSTLSGYHLQNALGALNWLFLTKSRKPS